jgi:hypothetical protein
MQKYSVIFFLAILVGACSSDVVGIEQDLRPNFDTGYTIGSGHRSESDGDSADTASADYPMSAAADSTSSEERTGYTIGSGH